MDVVFEWDSAKALANLRRHGVSFEEARTAFADSLGLVIYDRDHSFDEPRYALLAFSARHRLVSVQCTERGRAVRIITARRATAAERRDYEETAR